MLSKKGFVFLLFLVLTGITTNSCKKENNDSLSTLLTNSPWQLASVQVYHYLGSSLVETDTLNTNCLLTQTFTFKSDNSCAYQNFICKAGSNSGQWQFSSDKLTLQCNMTCKDTVTGGRDTTDMPFNNAQIVNLGSYSLVLQTGDVNQYYSSTTTRVIKRYGFIHE